MPSLWAKITASMTVTRLDTLAVSFCTNCTSFVASTALWRTLQSLKTRVVGGGRRSEGQFGEQSNNQTGKYNQSFCPYKWKVTILRQSSITKVLWINKSRQCRIYKSLFLQPFSQILTQIETEITRINRPFYIFYNALWFLTNIQIHFVFSL